MAMKNKIDINQEYNNPEMDTGMDGMPPVEQEPDADTDIAVTSEQLTMMKQLASEQKFEELGRLTAELLNSAPAAAAPEMQM